MMELGLIACVVLLVGFLFAVRLGGRNATEPRYQLPLMNPSLVSTRLRFRASRYQSKKQISCGVRFWANRRCLLV